jgi:nucleoside-diphosphate-sugar epimerase|tara:strand:+ start:340 stop:501 length:162 start_codon:yes stop_codon:yes gene_type:complete
MITGERVSAVRVLMTGGAGLLGSHLAEKLIKIGHSVTVYNDFMRGEEAKRKIA